MVKLTWHNTDPATAKSLEPLVAKDLIRMSIHHPQDVIFHHVFTTNEPNSPLIVVWGERDNDAFQCEYVEQPVWKTLAELEADEKNEDNE